MDPAIETDPSLGIKVKREGGKLLDGTDCKIFLDKGASKSFISKTFYLNCPSLHSLPMLVPKTSSI